MNNGILEYWNNGILEDWKNKIFIRIERMENYLGIAYLKEPNIPIFQHSNIPIYDIIKR